MRVELHGSYVNVVSCGELAGSGAANKSNTYDSVNGPEYGSILRYSDDNLTARMMQGRKNKKHHPTLAQNPF